MKHSIISILAIGFVSFAPCCCAANGANTTKAASATAVQSTIGLAPQSIVGKTITFCYGAVDADYRFVNNTAAVANGKKGTYTYSKLSANTAKVLITYNSGDEKGTELLLTFKTATEGIVTEKPIMRNGSAVTPTDFSFTIK